LRKSRRLVAFNHLKSALMQSALRKNSRKIFPRGETKSYGKKFLRVITYSRKFAVQHKFMRNVKARKKARVCKKLRTRGETKSYGKKFLRVITCSRKFAAQHKFQRNVTAHKKARRQKNFADARRGCKFIPKRRRNAPAVFYIRSKLREKLTQSSRARRKIILHTRRFFK